MHSSCAEVRPNILPECAINVQLLHVQAGNAERVYLKALLLPVGTSIWSLL